MVDSKKFEKEILAVKSQLRELREIKEKLAKDFYDDLNERHGMSKEFVSNFTKLLSTESDRIEVSQKNLELEKQRLDNSQDQIRAFQRLIDMGVELNDEQKKQLDTAEKQARASHAQAQTLQKQVNAQKAYLNVAKGSESVALNTLSKFGLQKTAIGENTRAFAGQVNEAIKLDGVVGGVAKTFAKVGQGILEALNPLNVLYSVASKLFTANLEYLQRSTAAQAELTKATGATNVSIKAGMDIMRGVNYEEAAQAAIGLTSNFKGFLDLQSAAKQEMQLSAGRLAKLGVNTADYANSVEHMTKAMRMSGPEATKMFEGVASAAGDLGLTTAQATSQFTEFQGTLALYGPRIGKKFREIAAAAKSSGMEISEVISLGEQFDTFEGATKAVGQLNAYLGGPVLDSMEMFYLQTEKGPEAVKEHVVDALRASGKSIETMNYSEQKAFAETLGMKVDGFQKLMGYQSEESKLAEKKAAKEANTRERLMNGLDRVMSFMERIQATIQSIFENPALQGAIERLTTGFLNLFGSDSKSRIKTIGETMADMINGFLDGLSWAKKQIEFIVNFWKEGKGYTLEISDILMGIGAAWGTMKIAGAAKTLFGAAKGKLGSPGNPMHVTMGGGGPGSGGSGGYFSKEAREKRKQERIKKKEAKAEANFFRDAEKKSAKELSKKGPGKLAGIGTKLAGVKAKAGTKLAGISAKFGKGALKSGLKKVPVLGALAGIGFGIQRAMSGDYLGAALEVASGAASIIPGVGTAASVAIDAGLIARDVYKGNTGTAAAKGVATGVKGRGAMGATLAGKGALLAGGAGLAVGAAGGALIASRADQEKDAEKAGQRIAAGFIQEMKKNNEPVQFNIKLTADEMFGANSPVHQWIWDSVNKTMVEKTG